MATTRISTATARIGRARGNTDDARHRPAIPSARGSSGRGPQASAGGLLVGGGGSRGVRHALQPHELPAAALAAEVRADRPLPRRVRRAVRGDVHRDEAARARRQAARRLDRRRRALGFRERLASRRSRCRSGTTTRDTWPGRSPRPPRRPRSRTSGGRSHPGAARRSGSPPSDRCS